MVYITVIDEGNLVTLNCHKNSRDGEFFQLVIDANTREVVKKPAEPDIDVSAAYSHIYTLLKSGDPLPKETVAAWG